MPEELPYKNETTNAVLAEKINGLSKITDDRLLNIKETLARIELSAAHYAMKSEVEEVKKDFNQKVEEVRAESLKNSIETKEALVQHYKDDKDSFGSLERGQRKTQDTINKWGGAITLILISLPFLVPLILKQLHLI